MALNTVTQRQYCAPSAAASIALPVTAGTFATNAWQELVAATDADWVLTGITVRATTTSGSDPEVEIDIGVGAAGAEVVIASFRFFNMGASGTNTGGGPGVLYCPIAVDAIPSGSRIAARERLDKPTLQSFAVALLYVKKPIVGTMQTTTKPIKSMAGAAVAPLLTAPATAWANSAWVQLRASGPAIWLVGVAPATINGGGYSWEIDIGVGAIGAEAVATTLRGHQASFQGPILTPAIFQPRALASGRVAARLRSSAGSMQVRCGLLYVEDPP